MINPMSMEGKTIIVTGAASGIGRATSVLLSKLGASVLLLDIDGEGLEAVKDEIKTNAVVKKVDLTDFENIKSVLMQAKDEIGKDFTGLVHGAGIPSVVPLRGLSNEQFEKVMKINVQSGINLAKIFSSKQGHDANVQGNIVFIASVYGLVGSAANVAYSASKAAIVGITKSLAIELAPKNIRVNCVAPGFVKTNMGDAVNSLFDSAYSDQIESMHPLGWGEAEDIANAIAFLLSDASKWTTGTVLSVDGGFTAQ